MHSGCETRTHITKSKYELVVKKTTTTVVLITITS